MPVLRLTVFAVFLLGCAPLTVARDLAVVSNKSNTVTVMEMPDLIKICKGKTSRWPDGKPVTFIARDLDSPDMHMVLEKVYGLSKDEVSDLIDAANHGRTNHPAIILVGTDDALVKKVESTPGAIGLVDVYSITGGVNVLKLGGKLPLEPGYPLHGN